MKKIVYLIVSIYSSFSFAQIDSLVNCPNWKFAIGVDEPFLDIDEEVLDKDGYFHISAEHQAVDDNGIYTPGLNLYSILYDDKDSEEGFLELDNFKINWEIIAESQNQCKSPELRDLNAGLGFIGNKIDDLPNNMGITRVMAKYSFTHPYETTTPWIKAGDRFNIIASTTIPETDQVLTDTLKLMIDPGLKYFHVTTNETFNSDTIWRLSDSDFHQEYNDKRFDVPLSSGDSLKLVSYVFDKYRNPLLEGTPIFWGLMGGGKLGNDFSILDDAPLPKQEMEDSVRTNGRVEIWFKQDRYPHCPWQDNLPDASRILLGVDGTEDVLNFSKTNRTEALPPPLLPITMTTSLMRYDGECDNPDIYLGHTLICNVILRRGTQPVQNAKVYFNSLNGSFDSSGSKADSLSTKRTKADGSVTNTIFSQEARVGPITVIVATEAERKVLTKCTLTDAPLKWISTAPLQVDIKYPVLVGDAIANGCLEVETLDDTGESLVVPNATEGDYLLKVPYFVETPVTIKGQPNHIYHVDVFDEQYCQKTAHYRFNNLDSNITPDEINGNDGIVTGTNLDMINHFEGTASLRFNASDNVLIPTHNAINLNDLTSISLAINPQIINASTILERPQQYKLELLNSGALRFTIWGINKCGEIFSHFIDSAPVTPNQWTTVKLQYINNNLVITTSLDNYHTDSKYINIPNFSLKFSNQDVIVGGNYIGNIDNLCYERKGFGVPLVETSNVCPDGTIVTNAQGIATFYIRSTNNLNSNDYKPVNIHLEIHGSKGFKEILRLTHEKIFGTMMNCGKAFLADELGKDAKWYHRAIHWVKDYIPIVSNLAELGKEIYKGISGCDKVSALNITFAMVGLVAEIATFGAAGAAIKAGGKILQSVGKAFLKEIAISVAVGETFKLSVGVFMKSITDAIAEADKRGQPEPAWIEKSESFMQTVGNWVSSTDDKLKKVLSNAFSSGQDFFGWITIYDDLGASGFNVIFQELKN